MNEQGANEARLKTEKPQGGFRVHGRLVHADGKPLSKATVRAFDRDLRAEGFLGETVTGPDGRYEIHYGPAQFNRAEKGSADLLVRAFGPNNQVAASSPIRFNAGPDETVDLVVGGAEYRGPSEFAELVAELKPLLQGLSLGDLKEDEEHQDFSFLSAETGRDAGRIQLLAAAHRLEAEAEIPAEACYGLVRQGLPATAPALVAQSPATLHRALVRSADENITAAEWASRADEIVAAVRSLAVKLALRPAGQEGRAPLGDLLGITLKNARQRESFLNAYIEHKGTVAEFWDSLAQKSEFKNRVADIQRTLQLGALTGNHLPLVQELERMHKSGQIKELSDLARLDESGWLKLAAAAGAPPGVPGADADEQAQNYARAMSHLVEDAFPTAFVAARLENDSLPGHADMAAVLKAAPDFNLRSGRITSYLQEHPDAVAGVQNPAAVRRQIQALQRVYRLAPRYGQAGALLKGGVDSAHAIARMGENVFTQQYAMAAGGQAYAKQIYARARHVQAVALQLALEYGTASGKTPTAAVPDEAVAEVEGVPEWSSLFGSLELCSCESCRSVYSPAAYLVDILHFLKDRPSTVAGKGAKEILFMRRADLGEIELTCENTNTPLPYVDLVNEVLEDAVAPPPAFTPYNLPAAAEADLNSRTLSPALQAAFTPPLTPAAVIAVGGQGQPWETDPDWWTIDEPAYTYTIRKESGQVRVVARSRQTRGSAAERAANPQYINGPAYDTLGRAVYPWSLPFHLWTAEARAYLGHLEVPLHQVMETFRAGTRAAILGSAALAREQLGLTAAAADMITGAVTSQPGAAEPGAWNLWGFNRQTLTALDSIPDPSDSTRRITAGNWLNVLKGRVDVFLRQSGLSYTDLLDLLDTYYINPMAGAARTITIVSTDPDHPDTCEAHKLKLQGLDAAAANRIVRFVRLQRALGWSMRDLDRAITAFAPAALNNTFLTQLAHVQRLHAATNLPVARLLGWWANLDTAAYLDHRATGAPRAASVYAQVFRNPATVNPPDPALTEDPADLAGSLSGRSAALCAALGVSAADLALLLADTNVVPDDTLSLDRLSRLSRHAGLARALRLPVRDYLSALRLVSANPFASTTDTHIFMETAERVRESGFTFAELDYLLRHATVPDAPAAPAEEAVAAFLDELRAGLQKVAAENTFRSDADDPAGPTSDPSGDLTRAKLALLDWDPGLVAEAVATLNGAAVYRAPLAALPVGLTLPNAPAVFTAGLAALPGGFTFPAELDGVVAYDAANLRLTAARFLTAAERSLLQAAAAATGHAGLIAAVNTLFQEQDGRQGEISFDAAAGELRFTGPMTNARKNRLDAASANAAYRAAVQALYDAPRRFVSRAMRTFGVRDFSAALAALPAGLNFPASLRRRVYHDGTALHFVGVMREAERDALLALAADGPYQAAVNALYAQPEAVVPAAGAAFLTSAGAGNDAAAMFDAAAEPGDRFLRVLQRLLPYLRRTLSERLAVQAAAEALALEPRAMDALLQTWLASPADPEPNPALRRRCLAELLAPAFAESNPAVKLTAAGFPAQFQTFVKAHKAAVVAARLKLGHRQLTWLFDHGPGAGWLDLNALPVASGQPAAPFAGWLRLAELARLRDGLPQGEKALDQMLAAAASGTKQAWFEVAMRFTQWSQADLETLLGDMTDPTQTGLYAAAFPADYRSERLPARLREAFGLLRRLGMPALQAAELAAGGITQAQARGVRQAVRAKYEEEQWLTLAQPLRDILRGQQRAALADYLVAHGLTDNVTVNSADDLYAHFLIDVEMEPCMMTARIKQAISSVQLFAQRCLMNLEPDVSGSAQTDVKWRQWRWMKNYRVWEANRKVFLYPENWLEPELRDDKSPFFKELENELLQSDLTQETAEEAFLHYLDKLVQVARLDVVAVHHQLEQDETGQPAVDILHVFGRTRGMPQVYYYRRREDGFHWTAWERVDLEITGDHLMAVVWNRRLHLLWPVFTERARAASVTLQDGDLSGHNPGKYWEIKLAWSVLQQGKWQNARISTRAVEVDFTGPENERPDKFIFRTHVDPQNNLYVQVMEPYIIYNHIEYGDNAPAFRFDGFNAEPLQTEGWRDLVRRLTGTQYYRMYLQENVENCLYLPVNYDTPALRRTPGTFQVLPHSDGSAIGKSPLFYQDWRRTFFIEAVPTAVRVKGSVWGTGKVDPGLVFEIPEIYWEELLPFDPRGPVVNPEDPWIMDPTFPTGPGDDPVYDPVGAGMAEVITPMRRMAGTRRYAMSATYRRSGGGYRDRGFGGAAGWHITRMEPRYKFTSFYHPWVPAFVRELNRAGIDGLMQRRLQLLPHEFMPLAPGQPPYVPMDFKTDYEPHLVDHPIVLEPYPTEQLDFADGGYAIYNWELFFHAPLLIADRLSKNQRYEESQRWFHYIFDPTDTSGHPAPEKYWRTLPFHKRTREGYQRERIQYILHLLAAGTDPVQKAALPAQEKADLQSFEDAVARWRKDPFKPHLIARLRTTAYQKNVVMKYIDNLVAWGDQLFRRDTIESINEATQFYIMAADILGRRPEEVPPRASARVQTYNSLEPELDSFSNALVQIEEFVSPSAAGSTGTAPEVTLPSMLYFCVPKNDKLIGYWDTVADRLFKIRHCMNIEGVVRRLPLFEPPIDPGLLVKAAAAGVDIGSVLSDISAGPPNYRFQVLAEKATELCQELKSLGQAMLSALEKRDAERLALLRAQHETALLALIEQVRKFQKDEAEANKAALAESRRSAQTRYHHHLLSLGVPSAGGDRPALVANARHITVQQESGIPIIGYERQELTKMGESNDWHVEASWAEFFASVLHVVPNFNIQPWGIGATFGGSNLGAAASAFANRFQAAATQAGFEAGMAGKLGQYAIRSHDWVLQANMAAREIMQLDKQIVAADLRIQIAARELENHKRQLAQTREVEEFLKDKYTNQELYGWMIGQLATVYFQAYQLAYDMAKRAERAFRHELGLRDSTFIQFGYWDSLKKGLLSGDRLFQDIKRMEAAFLEQHKREYEITKHVSLAQLDPLALVQLRQTGSCTLSLPEALFDLDFSGHYMRRLRNVGVSIPCVTGPYTGVHCTLRLLRSSVRHASTLLGGKYARQEADPRFTDSLGAIQSIVTSRAEEDSGLFETNLNDGRFLPFEGAGAISEWQIELPAAFRQFDYDTITDVILHLRYTAREAGGALGQKAVLELHQSINQFVRTEGQQGLAQIVSLRHVFPTQWHRFLNPPAAAAGDQTLTMALGKDKFPFFLSDRTITIDALELFVKVKPAFAGTVNESTLKLSPAAGTAASAAPAAVAPWRGLLRAAKAPAGAPGNWTLTAWVDPGDGSHEKLVPEAIAEIVVVCRYTVG